MPVRFPKMHIATSVVNRILNVADGIERSSPSIPSVPANIPDTAVAGANLDIALAEPVTGMPPISKAPDPGATLAGAPLLSTVLEPGT